MVGEHILKLLLEENARVEIGDNWMVCNKRAIPIFYTVYQTKPYKDTSELIGTENEELACKILKGE